MLALGSAVKVAPTHRKCRAAPTEGRKCHTKLFPVMFSVLDLLIMTIHCFSDCTVKQLFCCFISFSPSHPLLSSPPPALSSLSVDFLLRPRLPAAPSRQSDLISASSLPLRALCGIVRRETSDSGYSSELEEEGLAQLSSNTPALLGQVIRGCGPAGGLARRLRLKDEPCSALSPSLRMKSI